jgi:peptidoglycan/xylan/chitin deacetylase (PgdA/CDA1 family)
LFGDAAFEIGGIPECYALSDMHSAMIVSVSSSVKSGKIGSCRVEAAASTVKGSSIFDIDSPEGLDNLVELFLPIEEAAGATSANYIVPYAWPLNQSRLADIVARGHEIGIHGYDHSNRTSFLPVEERRQRLAAGHKLAIRFSAVGYRSPSLVRSRELLADLAPLYRYDSSIPTSGGPFPTANNGCASARPWRIGSLWEIPLSLPRDGSLRFLGYKPADIARMWIDCAGLVARSGGVVTLLTHCEAGFSGNTAMLAAYRQFIETMAGDPRFVFQLPRRLVDTLANRPR